MSAVVSGGVAANDPTQCNSSAAQDGDAIYVPGNERNRVTGHAFGECRNLTSPLSG